MKAIKEAQGSIIELTATSPLDVIIHGCNCFCNMGGGLARVISFNYPEIEQIDKETVAGDESKLGHHTKGIVRTNPELGFDKEFLIINAYTQYHPGTVENTEELYFNIRNAMRNIFILNREKMLSLFSEEEKEKVPESIRMGIPQIGSGIAGGDWNIIKNIILEEYRASRYCDDYELTFIQY